jgi:tetratricopeptide (TPR) repeat protein
VAPPQDQADTGGRPPLLDGETRAAAARARCATEPEAALGELIELRDQHAANAHVLHALALSLHEGGRAAEALECARAGIPLCLQRGQVALAADLFALHWKQARDLGLDHQQIDAVAGALFKRNDLAKAVAAYGLALTMDPADRKAVKGLLQAADQRLHREGKPKDALRIYTFLLQYAPDSPFADDMKRGLAEAEARVARAA